MDYRKPTMVTGRPTYASGDQLGSPETQVMSYKREGFRTPTWVSGEWAREMGLQGWVSRDVALEVGLQSRVSGDADVG